MRVPAIATLVVATAISIGLAACNGAGAGGASGGEQAAVRKAEPGPGDHIGSVTTVTGAVLPGGYDVDYSDGSHMAPPFAWKNGIGESASLEDYRGKVVLVNFWGTWCPPCRAELPDIVQLRNDLGPKGFEVIGVAIGEHVPQGTSVEEHLAQFAKSNNLQYPLVLGNQDLMQQYGGIAAVPTSFVVDREGHIVNMLVGGKSEEQFREAIEAAL